MNLAFKPVAIPEGIGDKIDLRTALKLKLDAIQKIAKQYEELIGDVEISIQAHLEKEGTLAGAGKSATVSITESVVPTVKDWDQFYAFIHKKKWYHLLERRPSVTGCREIFEMNGKLPGVEPFTKRKLNFTSKKG